MTTVRIREILRSKKPEMIEHLVRLSDYFINFRYHMRERQPQNFEK